jgi:hypothetical protein
MLTSVTLLFLATLLVTRLAPAAFLGTVTRVAAHRATVLIVGGLTAARVAQAWGSWNAPPVYHDEMAYVLQANIFAGLRWSAPAPPVPEAFEQVHVLVEPRYASKYFPGHSLVLAPFALIGVPGLAVIVLSGLTGVLLLLVGRHIAGPSVALLAWALWMSSPQHLTWRAAYFSETTSSCCVLLAAFGVLQWRKTNATRWLLVVAGALGWCAITRPLTAAIVAIPAGAAVLWLCRSRRSFAGLGRAFALGSAIVALLPLWAWRTTGNPLRTPYAEWTAQYLPFDVMGFAAAAPEPRRPLPADLRTVYDQFRAQRLAYTSDRYWPTVRERGTSLARVSMARRFAVFLPLALLGLAAGGAFVWAAALACVLHLLAHGFYYHDVSWTVYYMEYFPLVPLLVAIGTGWLFVKCARAGGPRNGHAGGWDPFATFALAGTLAVWADAVVPQRSENIWMRRAVEFRDRVSRLDGTGKIVFVRSAPRANPHFVLGANQYPPDQSTTWIVHDHGAERNALLQRAAPSRTAWLYDEESGRFSPVAASVAARGYVPE